MKIEEEISYATSVIKKLNVVNNSGVISIDDQRKVLSRLYNTLEHERVKRAVLAVYDSLEEKVHPERGVTTYEHI